MTTNYTDNIGVTLIGTGEQAGTWGTTTNTNFGVFDQSITGYEEVDVGSSNNYTLVFTDGTLSEAKNAVISIVGTPTADCTINVPQSKSRLYTFINNITPTNYKIVIKSVSNVNTVTIPYGKTTQVYTDGTNVYPASDYYPTMRLGAALPVASGGTGQTTYTDGQLLIGNTSTGGLSKATITGGSGIQVTNGNGSITIANTQGGGTVTSINVTGGTTGLTTTGGPVTTTGTIQLEGTLGVSNGGTGATSAAAARTALQVPSTTGSGATGTWNINVSGTSGATETATKLATTTGSAPVYGVRAFATFGWTSPNFTVFNSGNMTVARVSTGNYQIYFSTAMPTQYYSVVCTEGATGRTSANTFNVASNTITTSGFSLYVSDGTGVAMDRPWLSLIVVC